MKRRKWIKIPTSALSITLFLIGFGVGFSTKELTQNQDKNFERSHLSSAKENSLAKNIKQPISVCFTPNKQCQTNIVDAINAAKKSIYVQAYSFTDIDIASALASAASRKVDVKVLLDKSNRTDGRSAKDILLAKHVPTRFDAPHGIAHNKIMIIDEAIVITGSYNYSAAAYKRNTENVLLIHDSSLAHAYLQNWQNRWKLSK